MVIMQNHNHFIQDIVEKQFEVFQDGNKKSTLLL